MSKPTKQQAAEAYWSSAAAERSLTCPVRTTLNVLGGKWKLLILSYLLDEPRRYGELRRLMPEITEKMLIQELRELEADGIVARTVHQTVPPRVDYSLTEQGQRVRPVFAELLGWGMQYLGRPGGCPLPETPAATVAVYVLENEQYQLAGEFYEPGLIPMCTLLGLSLEWTEVFTEK